MDYIFLWTQQLLSSYGILAVFLVGVIEEVIFFIPSSLVFLAVGFFMLGPELSWLEAFLQAFFKIAIWGALGATLASFFLYLIFYWGGKPAIEKLGKYVGISWSGIEKVEQKFTAGYTDEIVIFLLRALPIWSTSIVSAFCGLIRLPWKTFGFYTFLGIVVRVTVLALIGWQLGDAYHHFGGKVEQWGKYGTVFLVASLATFLFFVYKANRK